MELLDLLSKISMPILTLATIFLTFYIHRLSSESNKKDNYLRYITDLYYRITDDSSRLLKDVCKQTKLSEMEYENDQRYRRQIAVNSTLMFYYVRRFPGYYEGRGRFEMILIGISRHPEKYELYERLSREFEDFCWGVKQRKRNNHNFRFDRIGYAEEGL